MVIYLDRLIIITLLTNGVIFYTAGILGGQKIRKMRIAIATILALGLTLALLTPYGICLASPAGKIVSSVILAAVAYKWCNWRQYMRQLIILLLTAAVMSSLTMLSHTLSHTVPVTTGIALPNARPSLFNLLTALALLGLFTFYHRKLKALPPEDVFFDVELVLDGKSCKLRALADTGNRLCSAEGKGVILASAQTLAELLPDNLNRLLETRPSLSADQILIASAEEDYAKRLQLIAYTTIDRHSLLPAMRLDLATVYNGAKIPLSFAKPVVAFAPQIGEKKRDYDLIIPPQFLR